MLSPSSELCGTMQQVLSFCNIGVATTRTTFIGLLNTSSRLFTTVRTSQWMRNMKIVDDGHAGYPDSFRVQRRTSNATLKYLIQNTMALRTKEIWPLPHQEINNINWTPIGHHGRVTSSRTIGATLIACCRRHIHMVINILWQ
jgi:hypothetical protein